ncbi:hypothetical protein IK7_05450 [Bacillus cereus VD156]|uniref:hypothetical protein n=1 Tax=Bacillus cereus TaxID=1396 RepID=UPI000279AD67|nr:hypothetical protein [Bacillus cereus]EJR74849.1 hypothetical protein IK7_05450 [Bacillus cereus VD156]
MEDKHGLNQYRINGARDYARSITEMVAKIDMLFYLSQVGHIDEEKAEIGIKNLTDVIKQDTEELLNYLKQRDDTQ